MKLTQEKLMQIIKEEMQTVNEMGQMTPATDFAAERDALQGQYDEMNPLALEFQNAIQAALRNVVNKIPREEIEAVLERVKSLF